MHNSTPCEGIPPDSLWRAILMGAGTRKGTPPPVGSFGQSGRIGGARTFPGRIARWKVPYDWEKRVRMLPGQTPSRRGSPGSPHRALTSFELQSGHRIFFPLPRNRFPHALHRWVSSSASRMVISIGPPAEHMASPPAGGIAWILRLYQGDPGFRPGRRLRFHQEVVPGRSVFPQSFFSGHEISTPSVAAIV